MEKDKIKQTVREIIISVLKHDNFNMNDSLTAADVKGWDSLTHMTIITEIEKKFNTKFKLKELNRLKNMGTLVELIQLKLQPS